MNKKQRFPYRISGNEIVPFINIIMVLEQSIREIYLLNTNVGLIGFIHFQYMI